MVVLAAALKSIPVEVLEAARVDGAGEWELFRRVMLPMLSLPISPFGPRRRVARLAFR